MQLSLLLTLILARTLARSTNPDYVAPPPSPPRVRKVRRRMSVNSQLFARGPWGAYNNPSNIIGTFWIEEKQDGERLSLHELKLLLRTRVLRFERLRSLLVDDGCGLKEWAPTDEDKVDLDATVTEISIATRAEIKNVVGSRLRRAWEPGMLAWRSYLVRVDDDPTVSCIVMDMHHGLGDGLSLVRVLFDLLTTEGGERLPPMMDIKNKKSNGPKKSLALKLARSVAFHIWALFAFLLGLWHVILTVVWTADSPNALKSPHFPLYHPLTEKMSIEYLPDVSLEAVKNIKNAYGNRTTLNDIIVAALGGAYRKLLLEIKDPLLNRVAEEKDNESMLFRAFCPFSFPRPIGPDDTEMHNGFAFVTLALPVGVAGAPSRRVARTREITNKVKASLEPVALALAQALLAHTIGFDVLGFIAVQMNLRHSILFTNVPGPEFQTHLAGRKVIAMNPTVAGAGSSWTLLSYAGRVQVSYNYETKYYGKNPERIGQLFVAELEHMQRELGLENELLLL